MKWVVVVTAPDQTVAETWASVLIDHGIPAMVKPGDTSSFLGVSPFPCRLMVTEDRESEAKAILRDELGMEM